MSEQAPSELTLIEKPARSGWWRAPGDCVLTRSDDGRVRVEQADPRTWVSAHLLDMIREGDCSPYVTLDGDILRIEGVNRTVIYRIGDQVPDLFAYYAEFPD